MAPVCSVTYGGSTISDGAVVAAVVGTTCTSVLTCTDADGDMLRGSVAASTGTGTLTVSHIGTPAAADSVPVQVNWSDGTVVGGMMFTITVTDTTIGGGTNSAPTCEFFWHWSGNQTRGQAASSGSVTLPLAPGDCMIHVECSDPDGDSVTVTLHSSGGSSEAGTGTSGSLFVTESIDASMVGLTADLSVDWDDSSSGSGTCDLSLSIVSEQDISDDIEDGGDGGFVPGFGGVLAAMSLLGAVLVLAGRRRD